MITNKQQPAPDNKPANNTPKSGASTNKPTSATKATSTSKATSASKATSTSSTKKSLPQTGDMTAPFAAIGLIGVMLLVAARRLREE